MNFNSPIFKLWPLSNYEAITLPWGVYFKNSKEKTSLRVICHEQVHIDQIKELGIIKFYSQYVIEYLTHLLKLRNHGKAYRAISFEREAYRKCK